MFAGQRVYKVSAMILAGLLAFSGGCASQKPAAVESNRKYVFWPSAPDEPHVQFLTTFNSSKDVQPESSGYENLLYGKDSQAVMSIAKPYGVRFWNGRIYICDIRSRGIMILDMKKQQARLMGVSGSGSIDKAVDLAISPDGIKYVVDPAKQAIMVFDADEKFVSMFPLVGSNPVGIAVHDNLLYVADFKAAHIKVLDRASGQVLRTIGEKGGEDGQFIGPLAVATDKEGNVYVADTIKARVQKFSPDGKLLLAFGSSGDRPGNFVRPKQLNVGSDGRIHVVDAAFDNVQVFDPEGKFEGVYGGPGGSAGAMQLPAGMDLTEKDLDLFEKYANPAFQIERVIFVANQFGGQKVSAYAMGHLKEGKTVADIAGSRAFTPTGILPATQPTTNPAAATARASVGATAAKP